MTSRGRTPTASTRFRDYFVHKTQLGIPILPFEEAVHGLSREGATMFPAAIGLAATWDTDLMARVSGAIADEAKSRGIRDVLSPVINIADDVRWGRVEETYGEDPMLSSAMARVFVSTFERAGVITTPKHFIANVGEGGRDSYPIDYSERRLQERYFPPFVAAIEAGARSVMAAYNSVDGSPATQNRRLLDGILKTDWGFKGFVISDASGHERRDRPPHDRTQHRERGDGRVQRRPRCGVPVVLRATAPVLDAFQRGLIPHAGDRRRGHALLRV